MKAFILAMLIAGTCWGQTTQPTTTVASDSYPAMSRRLREVLIQASAQKEEIDSLKHQLSLVQAENAALKESLAELSNTPKGKAILNEKQAIAQAITQRRLTTGMTLDEANQAMRSKARKTGENADGYGLYEWRSGGQVVFNPKSGERLGQNPVEITSATFKDGKLVSFVQ